MTTVWEWPLEWYRFSSMSFRLRPLTLVAPHRWTGARAAYGSICDVWTVRLTCVPVHWDVEGQAMAAFFERLNGQAGLIRIGDVSRRVPLRDRGASPSAEPWSDGSTFSDTTGFVSGLLPPIVHLETAVAQGANTIIIGGLPASEAAVLRPGDLIELRPNGIGGATPNLYSVQHAAPTDASGRTGVEIRPSLRQSFAAGDMVVLRNPTSVFRLIDDEQGVPEVALAGITSLGFSLAEAIV